MDFLYLFKDINFQKGFLLFAAFILIIMIINIAYNLNKTGGGQLTRWPPIVAPCPDYWDLSGNYCINVNGQNVGNNDYWEPEILCNNININNPYDSTKQIRCSNYDSLRTIPIRAINYETNKSKTDWANKHGFVWDGLTSNGPKAMAQM